MKKLLSISLILAISISLCSCGTSNVTSTDKAVVAKAQTKTVENTNKNEVNNESKNEAASNVQADVKTEQPAQSPAVPQPETQIPQLDTKYTEWYNTRNLNHTTPGIPENAGPWLSKYNAIFTGDTSKKTFYFTFDAGGDTGYANQILDTLNKHGIKATFFLTKPYITQNPSIVKRIAKEGQAAANHTVNHLGLPKLSDEQIKQEYQGVEEEYTRVTGGALLKCVRPPMGAYSEKSLYVTNKLGYKTVFWSIAYFDYDVNNQPTHDAAMTIIKNNYHNGAICLLHIASKTDADTLDEMISFLKAQGYSFGEIS